jgi:Leucine-rich repeat (LRR) protein
MVRGKKSINKERLDKEVVKFEDLNPDIYNKIANYLKSTASSSLTKAWSKSLKRTTIEILDKTIGQKNLEKKLYAYRNTLEVLNVSNLRRLKDLTFLQDFPKLVGLYCNNTKINKVPTLNSLEYLVCNGCHEIRKIKEQPNLIGLDCSNIYNRHLTLPKTFLKLKELSCAYTYVRKIPETPMLEYLNITGTYIIEIPDNPHLHTLKCEQTLIQHIPLLIGLDSLSCGSSQIEILETFPNLHFLSCSNCVELRILRTQPNLRTLNCNYCPNLREIDVQPNVTTLTYAETPITVNSTIFPRIG